MTSQLEIPEFCKAITYSRRGKPKDVLTFEDQFPVPKQIPKGQFLIKTESVAINPVDFKFMENVPSFSKKIVGSDFSGTIVKLYQDYNQDKFKIGDKVYGAIDPSKKFMKGQGSFGQFILVDEKFCSKVPTNVSSEEVAGCPIVGWTATGMSRLTKDFPQNEQTRILVCGGSSAVGLMLIPILKSKGFFVVSTCSESKFDFIKKRGADQTFDYRNKDFQSNLISECEKQGQFDLILDCVESYDVLSISPKILKKGSRYGNVGFDSSNGMLRGVIKNLSYHILPTFLGGIPSKYERVAAIPSQELMEEFNDYLEKGITTPIVDSTFTWEQTKEAFAKCQTNRCMGKVIVKVPK